MVHFYRIFLCVAAALWSISEPAWAQGARGAPVGIDYTLVSREIHGFEKAVNKALSATFSGAPFALSQPTKGVYLQGYGVTLSFTVNIHRALVTPFGVVPGDEITPEQKRRRIEALKDSLSHVLLDNGESLRQVRRDDCIAIIGFIEDRNFPEEENQNKTIILSVQKKDLDEAVRAEDRWKEFKLRLKTVEY